MQSSVAITSLGYPLTMQNILIREAREEDVTRILELYREAGIES